MALGSYSNNSNAKKDYSPVTYSQVRFLNSESSIDPSAMSFSYWKGLLKVSLSPVKIAQGSAPEIDRDNCTDIYLTPYSAQLFLEYVKAFKNDPNLYTNVGVSTNKGLIYITNGKAEFGVNDDAIFIVVKLVDEQGNITSAIAYQFNKNRYYGITDYNGGTDFGKNYDYAATLELDMFMKVLESYVVSANNAFAASVAETMHYTTNSIKSKLTSIQENLGIETGKSYNSPKPNASSFWNNNGSASGGGNNVQSNDYSNYNELIDDLSDIG